MSYPYRWAVTVSSSLDGLGGLEPPASRLADDTHCPTRAILGRVIAEHNLNLSRIILRLLGPYQPHFD